MKFDLLDRENLLRWEFLSQNSKTNRQCYKISFHRRRVPPFYPKVY